MRTLLIIVLFMCCVPTRTAGAQDYVHQKELEQILGPCSVDQSVPERVEYEYRVLYSSRNNSVLARATFHKIIGDGDVYLGLERSKLVGLLNRTLIPRRQIGDTLVVPTKFVDDFCAYSPFPRYYTGALSFDKLFVMDKTIQAWAAYEKGRLARWGIINTGAKASPTPTGRFNFNWKTEYRISTLSPPGERWEMYWVFNFHESRGIHVHQYPMPTGGPTSHGCVRLVEEDAAWIYDWADQWKMTKGAGFRSGRGTVKESGTTVIVIGKDPTGNPIPFDRSGRYPIINMVDLPDHPYDVPPGTSQQRYFDRLRAQRGE